MFLLSAVLFIAPVLQAQESEARTAADWDRAALVAGAHFDTDAELLARLRALELEDTDARRLELGRLAETRKRLRLTLRHDPTEGLQTLALSHDATLLATSDGRTWRRPRPGRLRVADARDGRLLWEAVGRYPRFSNGGTWLAAYGDEWAKMWNARTGELVCDVPVFPGMRPKVTDVIPSPTGELLAIIANHDECEHGDLVLLWDVAQGELADETVTVGSRWASAFAFDPTGTYFACSTDNDEGCTAPLLLWSREGGWKQLEPHGKWANWVHGGNCGPVAFTASGERLATLGPGGEARVYSTRTGELTSEGCWFADWNQELAFRSESELVLRMADTVIAWDVDSLAPAGRPPARDNFEDEWRDDKDHTGYALSPDGLWHAAGGKGDSMRVWSTRDGNMCEPLLTERGAHLVAFAADGRTVATASRSGLVRVWELEREPAPERPPTFIDTSRTEAGWFEREAEGIREHKYTSIVLLADLQNGALREVYRGGTLWALCCDAAGGGVALGGNAGELIRLDWGGERLGPPLYHCEPIWRAAWSGPRVYASTWNHDWTWDLGTGGPPRPDNSLSPFDVVLTSDGRELVTLDESDNRIRRNSVTTGLSLGHHEPQGKYDHRCLSPSGRLAAFGRDQVLRVFDTASGERVSEVSLAGELVSLSFAVDDDVLVFTVRGEEAGRLDCWSWDPRESSPAVRLPVQTDGGGQLHAHVGSQRLALVEGEQLLLLSLEDGRTLAKLGPLPAELRGARMDPSGRHLALVFYEEAEELHPLEWATAPAGLEEEALRRRAEQDALWAPEDLAEVIPAGLALPPGHQIAIHPTGLVAWAEPLGGENLKWRSPAGAKGWKWITNRDDPWIADLEVEPVGGELYYLLSNGNVHRYRPGDEERGRLVLTVPGCSEQLAVGGAGKRLALSKGSAVLAVLDAHDERTRQALAQGADAVATGDHELELTRTHAAGVGLITALAVDPAGSLLAVGSWEGGLRLLDFESGEARGVTRQLSAPIVALALGPEQQLAVATLDGRLLVFEGEAGSPVGLPVEHPPLAALAYTASGGLLGCGESGGLYEWTPGGEVLTRLEDPKIGPAPAFVAGAFDVSRELLALATEERTVGVWHLADAQWVAPPFLAFWEPVELKFSADSRRLVIDDGDDQVALHDIATGALVRGPFDVGYERERLTPGGLDMVVVRGEDGGPYELVDLDTGETLWGGEWRSATRTPASSRRILGPFHPAGDRFVVRDGANMSLLGIEGGGVKPIATRRLPRLEADPFSSSNHPYFLADGRVFLGLDKDEAPSVPVLIDFTGPGDVRLEGEPTALRREWEVRLGLRVEGDELVRRE